MREFFVETPLGKLKIWSKHEVDNESDFPGVYIDLVHPEDNVLLACVEYDSVDHCLQTVVYGISSNDEPTDIIKHELEGVI